MHRCVKRDPHRMNCLNEQWLRFHTTNWQRYKHVWHKSILFGCSTSATSLKLKSLSGSAKWKLRRVFKNYAIFHRRDACTRKLKVSIFLFLRRRIGAQWVELSLVFYSKEAKIKKKAFVLPHQRLLQPDVQIYSLAFHCACKKLKYSTS